MLNEIAPNEFSIDYCYKRPPHPGDIIAAFTPRGVLKVPHGDFYRFSDLPAAPPAAFTYLLAVGNIAVYSCAPELLRELRPEAVEMPIRELRTYKPQWLAFAIVTASHLASWYRVHRFCGACGTPTELSPSERAITCPNCQLTTYPRISPAVIVAIQKGDSLLLTRYKDRPVKHWALVAGYVEVGETLEDTIHREVMEEVNLKVKNLRYYCSQPWSFSQSLLVGYFAELDGDDTMHVDGVELGEARWFKRDELPQLPHTLTLTNTLIEAFRAMRNS